MRTLLSGLLFCCPALTPWLPAQDDAIEILTIKENVGAFCCVAFSGDGTTLAFSGSANTVRVWDVATRKEKAILHGHTRWARSIVLSRNGNLLASAGDDGIKLWEVNTAKVKATLNGPVTDVYSLALTGDDSLLALGIAPIVSGIEPGTVKLWDIAAGKEKAASIRTKEAWCLSPSAPMVGCLQPRAHGESCTCGTWLPAKKWAPLSIPAHQHSRKYHCL